MADYPRHTLPRETLDYLAQRLDGARDLYLLALALGARDQGAPLLSRMIREARIHFAAVIEEARIGGLDTQGIAEVLAKTVPVADSIRPELWTHLEQMIADGPGRKRGTAT
jgi:hypothetical protein